MHSHLNVSRVPLFFEAEGGLGSQFIIPTFHSEDLAQNDEFSGRTLALFLQPLQPMISVNQLTISYHAPDPTFRDGFGSYFIKVFFVGDYHLVDLQGPDRQLSKFRLLMRRAWVYSLEVAATDHNKNK